MVNVPTFVDIPIFGGASSRIQPSPTVYAGGYLPGQAYPAENHNFFLNGLTDNGITEQDSIISLVTEFTNFLAAYSVTPDPLLFNQFLTTFQAQMALKANLASPTFTGTVTVPNGSASGAAVNKSQLDLKANTNSPTFTGTVTVPNGAVSGAAVNKSQLDLKADLASPAFTGTPTVPTLTGGSQIVNNTRGAQLVTACAFYNQAGDVLNTGVTNFSVNTGVSDLDTGEGRYYKNTSGSARSLTFSNGTGFEISSESYGFATRLEGDAVSIPAGITVLVKRTR